MKKKTESKKCAPKVAAQKVAVKKSANILLERTDKVVTKDKNSVLKIFGPSYKVSAILNEAMNEARAAETGLPVAKVLEVLKLRDHWCIRRELIEGKTLAETMAGAIASTDSPASVVMLIFPVELIMCTVLTEKHLECSSENR